MPGNTLSASTAFSPAPEMDIKGVFDLIRPDFDALNQLIPQQLTSDVKLVEEIGHYITESGGKRLRPLLVLLAANCLGYRGTQHHKLAAIIEFLHTATLLHDDVVDKSNLRRGRATANALWGNQPSVLVGDFLYSRAFQLMVDLGSLDIMAILSHATNVIAAGEVQQLANLGDVSLIEADYMEVIRCKTAMLFQASSHTAGVLSTQNKSHINALEQFGLHLGLAYQLVDDWLDYAGDSQLMGKNVGDDLAEGKVTLPLIHALKHASKGQANIILKAVAEPDSADIGAIAAIVQTSGALDYTREKAVNESLTAIGELQVLPENEYREALKVLARFAVSRLS